MTQVLRRVVNRIWSPAGTLATFDVLRQRALGPNPPFPAGALSN